MSLVSLVKINHKNQNPLKQAIIESLQLIDYSFDKTIKKVVIKPNLCYYWDCSTGQTSDPRFVAELIDLLRQEISAMSRLRLWSRTLRRCVANTLLECLGLNAWQRRKMFGWLIFQRNPATTRMCHVNGKAYSFKVPKIIQEADLKINLPKIKYTVDPIKLTCALKNLYGCNPVPKKIQVPQ